MPLASRLCERLGLATNSPQVSEKREGRGGERKREYGRAHGWGRAGRVAAWLGEAGGVEAGGPPVNVTSRLRAPPVSCRPCPSPSPISSLCAVCGCCARQAHHPRGDGGGRAAHPQEHADRVCGPARKGGWGCRGRLPAGKGGRRLLAAGKGSRRRWPQGGCTLLRILDWFRLISIDGLID